MLDKMLMELIQLFWKVLLFTLLPKELSLSMAEINILNEYVGGCMSP